MRRPFLPMWFTLPRRSHSFIKLRGRTSLSDLVLEPLCRTIRPWFIADNPLLPGEKLFPCQRSCLVFLLSLPGKRLFEVFLPVLPLQLPHQNLFLFITSFPSAIRPVAPENDSLPFPDYPLAQIFPLRRKLPLSLVFRFSPRHNGHCLLSTRILPPFLTLSLFSLFQKVSAVFPMPSTDSPFREFRFSPFVPN